MFEWLSNVTRRWLSGERRSQARPKADPVRAAMARRAPKLADQEADTDFLPIGSLVGDASLPVALTRREARQHALVLGATGTGKSVLLTGVIAQILRRRTDEVVVLLDPHGAMDEPVLRLAAAAGARVVHLDLSGHGPLVTPWSPLGNMTGLTVDERAAVAHRAFSSAFAPSQGGGFVDSTLRAAMYLLACAPDEFTLAQAEPLLLVPGLAERVLARTPGVNPSVVSYVRQLRALGPRAAYTQTRFAFSRIDALLAAPGARATFCGRGSFDLAAFLRSPGVLVISAPRAVLAEAAVPICAWLLELLVHALMRRRLPCVDPHVTVVVDEVLAIGEKIPALTAVLAELRKFNVSLWGSLQSLTQCSDRRLVDEFTANTGIKILFGLSPSDAGKFADLLALPAPRRPRYEVGGGYVIRGGEAAFVEPGRERDRADVAAFERALRDAPRRTFHLGLSLGERPVTAQVRALPRVEIPTSRPRLLHARPLEQVSRELAQVADPAPTENTTAPTDRRVPPRDARQARHYPRGGAGPAGGLTRV